MANKVVFGLANAHVAFLDEATGIWSTPVPIPGAVNLALSGEGEESKFYADDMAYYIARANNGYSGDLEVAVMPDTVLATMQGWHVDDNGMLVEESDSEPGLFALLFEIQGNAAKKRYVFYKCSAGRPGVEHGTGETTEPKTTTLPLTITPIEVGGLTIVKAGVERTTANATAFDAFFDAVLEPVFSVS
jgi:phi13 family phage major tail protein